MYRRVQVIAKLRDGFQQLETISSSIGDLLVTSEASKFSAEEFNKKLSSLQTHVLSKMFPSGLKITTRSEDGRVHCHAAVSLNYIVPDFDWFSFDGAEKAYLKYRSTKDRSYLKQYIKYTKAYRNSMPPALAEMNHNLRIKAKAYGFGYIFVLPLRKGPEAYINYLTKNVPRRRQKRDKGVRFFSSWGLKTIKDFKVLTPSYNLYRKRLKTFCESVGMTADNYENVLKGVYGKKWHFYCLDLIKNIEHLPEELEPKYTEVKNSIARYLLRKD